MKYKSKSYFLIFKRTIRPCIGSMLVLEGSRTFLRPVYGTGDGFVAEFLGILPNLLAGFGMPLLPLSAYFVGFMELESNNFQKDSLEGYKMSKKQLMNSSLVFTVLTTLGLIFWEYRQINNPLIFDYKDIAATIIGGLVSVLFFKIIISKSDIKVA